jgi:hypothetical protein
MIEVSLSPLERFEQLDLLCSGIRAE